ncbi:PLP-dependent aminotransferase family protein [Actinocorallia longicatena]|uniref:PLP-dependent aminotransferase family protein n=1 Tax=Actinocorallia longicatena TaxID=111803 RepID=A0ABP6Q1U8_9ACTN
MTEAGVEEVRRLLGAWSGGEGALYQRLARKLGNLMEEGALGVGTRLPSERALAAGLAVSRRTVEAAYDRLRADGRLESQVGAGSWVAEAAAPRPHRTVDAHHVAHMAAQNAAAGGALIDLTLAAPPAHPLMARARAETSPPLSGSGYYPGGLPGLRERICAWFAGHGVPTAPDEVTVTAGAVQALWLAASALPAGAEVGVEDPTSPSILTALRAHALRLRPLPVDGHGAALPAAPLDGVVVTPAYANPSGALLSAGRAARLPGLATLVIEDLALLDLRLDGPRPLLLAGGANVLSIGTMSKVHWGGLRIGWVRGPRHLIRYIDAARGVMDLGASVDAQVQAAWLLEHQEEALAHRLPELRARRDALAAALTGHAPDWRWRLPGGGLSLWAELPDPVAPALLQHALRDGVALLPAEEFRVSSADARHLRLPFVHPPEVLAEAVARLAARHRALS